ncbi:MAG: nuclear transport factor 2 family protein [Anaerolineae bacterium]|uniref:nuclear transport factor 2 family protein n=1 Tax=Candidatus Flexifilum breve TaxID=3140694 RepID=UPI001AC21D66|nr:nuclear transport factor 2 family protein [Chloroflexota bacterium]MBN8637867.1 nuclear transport factor 2 family protein [Anaerolineae bacterium]
MSQAPAKFKAFYERQIEFLANNDAVGLIANQYTEDAELLSFTNHIVGAPALVEYFKGYIANLGYIKLISTDKYTEGDSSIFFEATVETAGGIARVYDVFVLRDGKIAHHFTGLLGFTPHAQN